MAILPSDRDQTTTQPILCNTSNGQPTFSVPELLHTFDALIVQSRSEIDEYLSRHPKLASNIRSLQSISAATISNDLPTPPPESPPPEKVGAADCRTCVSDDAGPKTNIQPLPGRSEYRTLRPLPSETPNPSVADPVSHDDSRKSLRKNGDVNAEVRLEKTKRSYAQLSDDGLKRDYILAKAAADVVANELTAPDTLIELREVILQERNPQHPNLKKDIEDLSFLMWHLLTYGVLPTQKLLLETLGELEIREMSQKNYRELLTFVDSPVRADVNGALEWPNPPHGNDDFSEDPAMLLQTAEQSAAEQQSAVAGSDSMRLLDELMEECIDPAVLGPNAAIPYVGAKM
ncbi:hypothetical protein MAC_06502 [Metarhizium acridum CQMa 102]|uniref:Uncharacterized protein n=1 Tax=Metarhizium acridum (strain CQMa 102) TaxID=655827 RepID=E9E9F4_METAQ|nr:uncharacterized protein MAC_06502 [Metarhizium acridum CQMa 102]EFY87394.1 hypothetical protein MAC_06502 [Metarhizium acridum CQMa 102]